jgi:hypothetical protein
MPWDLVGDVPVSFEGRQLDAPLIGDEIIKVEHTWDYGAFPGLGYAWISDLYSNDAELTFIKSYPKKDYARIYILEIPQVMKDAGWLLRYLTVRRSNRARVQADANWRMRISVWLGSEPPEEQIDGEGSTGGGQTIFDGT